MTDQKAMARRLLLEAAILAKLTERNRAARAEAAKLFEVGDAQTSRVGEDLLGRVRKDKGRRTATVVDREAFVAWMIENRPGDIKVTQQVYPATEKAILDQAKKDGGAFDRETGEEIPGIAVKVSEPSLNVSPEELAGDLAEVLLSALPLDSDALLTLLSSGRPELVPVHEAELVDDEEEAS